MQAFSSITKKLKKMYGFQDLILTKKKPMKTTFICRIHMGYLLSLFSVEMYEQFM